MRIASESGTGMASSYGPRPSRSWSRRRKRPFSAEHLLALVLGGEGEASAGEPTEPQRPRRARKAPKGAGAGHRGPRRGYDQAAAAAGAEFGPRQQGDRGGQEDRGLRGERGAQRGGEEHLRLAK